MADLSEIEALIAAHINAVAEHERLFNLEDWGLAPKEDVSAALTPIDDALVAICAARPADAAAEARRTKYINDKVAEAIYGDTGLTEAVIAALVGGAS
jgi:hypothetical protein